MTFGIFKWFLREIFWKNFQNFEFSLFSKKKSLWRKFSWFSQSVNELNQATFCPDFTRLGNFLRFFLERYLAETFRTINEVFKFMHFKTCFFFGTTPWCILRTVTLISVTAKLYPIISKMKDLCFSMGVMFQNTISDLNQKERRITALE